jgi:hypothetical protein
MTSDADQRFKQLEQEIVDGRLRWSPGTATGLGRHEFDAELGSRSREAIGARNQEVDGQLRRLQQIDEVPLSEPYRTRWPIHFRKLQGELSEERDYGASRHSPGAPLGMIGFSCNSLVIRDFAPLTDRVRSLTSRLSAAPRLLKEFRDTFESCSPIHVETALQQASGILTMLDRDLPGSVAGVEDPALRSAFGAARGEAVAAVHDYESWLRDTVRPGATLPIAWGRERMEKLVRLQEYVDTDIDTLVKRGREDLRWHQERLNELARQIDPSATPQEVVTGVGREHPAAGELLPSVQTTLEELRQFCIDRDLIDMPTEVRIQLKETPPFSRATTLAACSTPGMYETVATEAYYYVTPPDAAWDEQRTEQYLQFFNRWSTPLITAHEAYPGHYVHISWLRKAPDAVPGTNTTTTTEGWAHYTERLMIESGWGDGDPRYEIMQMREALLRLCRYLCAFGMHTQGWSYDDAVQFFMKEGFATLPVAELESKRGVVGPSYFAYTLGKHEILELREAVKQKWGSGYTLKRFHNAFVKEPHPTAVVAAKLLEGTAP